ncbi:MAG TPA: hypothetical protein VM618_10430 [Acidimicrobiia bacterium]|jgi:hypothetical protein|nr:hypothetical protein [Acidimicrobiia bacterium]
MTGPTNRHVPWCCGASMTPIVYGYPSDTMFEAAERGEIELGGCVVEDDLPMFRCATCGRTVGRLGDVRDEHFADDTWG